MAFALLGSKETRMHCAFCYREIDRLNGWRGPSGIIYCSEFCAEEYGLEPARAPSLPAPGTSTSATMRTEARGPDSFSSPDLPDASAVPNRWRA